MGSMNLKREINNVRRKIMRWLTKGVGTSYTLRNNTSSALEIKRILISRPNHRLGNLLLITPIIQEAIATFPDCKIDLFLKGNLPASVFKNYRNIDRLIILPKKVGRGFFSYLSRWLSLRKTHYDIAINTVNGSSSGRLSIFFSRSTYKFFGNETEAVLANHEAQHLAKAPVFYFRHYLTLLELKPNVQPVAALSIELDKNELAEGKKELDQIVNTQTKTICLFTYATGEKNYNQSWWIPFYEALKKEFPLFNFIEVLPVENVSSIGFQAPTYSNPDIRKVAALIANTNVFIGADSGVMHLACAAHAPTVGLFSVTDCEVYHPYGNKSIGINTNKTSINEIIARISSIV